MERLAVYEIGIGKLGALCFELVQPRYSMPRRPFLQASASVWEDVNRLFVHFGVGTPQLLLLHPTCCGLCIEGAAITHGTHTHARGRWQAVV